MIGTEATRSILRSRDCRKNLCWVVSDIPGYPSERKSAFYFWVLDGQATIVLAKWCGRMYPQLDCNACSHTPPTPIGKLVLGFLVFHDPRGSLCPEYPAGLSVSSERPFGGNTALFSQPTAVQNQSPWYPRQFGIRRSMLTALHITYLISTCLDPAVVPGRGLAANPGL